MFSLFRRRDGGLEQAILACLDELWNPEQHPRYGFPSGWALLSSADHPFHHPLLETLRRLQEQWTPAELGAQAARLYFDPAGWQHRYEPADWRRWALLRVLEAVLIRFPPPTVIALLEERIRRILERPYAGDAPRRGGFSFPPTDSYLAPGLRDCLSLLGALPPSPEALALIERILSGALNRPLAGLPPEVLRFFAASRPLRSYQLFSQDLAHGFAVLMERLHGQGRLDYDLFRRSAEHLPALVSLAGNPAGWLFRQASPRFAETVLGYCRRLADEVAENLTEGNYALLKAVTLERRSRYLLLAARYHSALRLDRLVVKDSAWRSGIDTAIIHLARAGAFEPASTEERSALIEQLKALPPRTVQRLLPVALPARRLLCEALGWERALPLLDQIVRISGSNQAVYPGEAIHNSPDPAVGVLDVGAVRSALAQAGDDLARRALALIRQAKIGADSVTFLIEAAAGWNRAAVEKGLPKRNQVALRAYGLLPLERGQDEVLERYLFITRFARESRQFGPQRQANEQAAAQAALANLAQVAGYADATRLEWAMEARLSQDVAPEERTWTAGEYTVRLTLTESGPALEVRRSGSRLKSVPAALRRSEQYGEMKEALAQLRGQLARLRATLEDLMASGEALSPADLETLLRMPAGRTLLARLILRDEGGTLGLLDPDGPALCTADGAHRPVEGTVTIAHPYHLFQAGELAAWQREIVHRRIVQPFKQAFRELYVLTPAEEETRTYSNRFAGHALDPRVVTQLLQARGWRIESGDGVLVSRPFPALRLQAVFDFPDAGHFLSETDVITSDRISFWPYPLPPGHWRAPDEARLPLAEIPPLVFSEVMRDADLIVSVAQRSGEARLSAEAYQRRGELVTALLEELGLPGVRVEGHFAYVQGRLARYRVHLGSAAIHIEPGNYLCIVPAGWGQRHEQLFLPFADEGDAKTSEAISKILLLLNDDKIKDESILRQIRAAGRT